MEILHGALYMRGRVGAGVMQTLGGAFFYCVSFVHLIVANLLPCEKKFRNFANYRKS